MRCRMMAGLAGWVLLGCSAVASPAEVDRIVAAMDLEPGMVVADVGAGEGEFALELARRVGEGGRVIATEVEEDKVAELRRLAESEGLKNLFTVLGDQTSTGLEAGCCDAILLRLVYHHFQQPPAMRADLRAALRPGGRLLVVDIEPQQSWPDLADVPDRGGHGIAPAALSDEMTGDGFELVARLDAWNGDDERFAMVFLKRSDLGGAPPP